MKMKQIKQALNFNFTRVRGCIVTHEHNDHACSINDMMRLGIYVYATKGTFDGKTGSRAKTIKPHAPFRIGSFKVMAFDVMHDAKEPVGFLIHHPESGNILFLTDSFYCPYAFNNVKLNNVIIEANFSRKIIDRKLKEEKAFLRNRILKSHMSLEYCKELLQANDLSQVNQIILIHLSDSNSNEEQFKHEVQELTGKNVTVASNGMEIPFNKTPF